MEIDNRINCINKIDIEIKYSDNNCILHKQTVALGKGVNHVVIPLKMLKSEALKQVSEMCFVIRPSAYIKKDGIFEIKNIKISH